jgi:hypothetical protein
VPGRQPVLCDGRAARRLEKKWKLGQQIERIAGFLRGLMVAENDKIDEGAS